MKNINFMYFMVCYKISRKIYSIKSKLCTILIRIIYKIYRSINIKTVKYPKFINNHIDRQLSNLGYGNPVVIIKGEIK